MEPGPMRRLAVMGFLAVIAMLVMYLFMAKQVTDTDMPRVRQFVHEVLKRSLEPKSEVKLSMRRLDKGLDAPRHYTLVFTPKSDLTADPRSLEKLVTRAASYVVEETKSRRGPVSVTCVALLPGGNEQRLTFDAKLQPMEEPEAPPPTSEE